MQLDSEKKAVKLQIWRQKLAKLFVSAMCDAIFRYKNSELSFE